MLERVKYETKEQSKNTKGIGWETRRGREKAQGAADDGVVWHSNSSLLKKTESLIPVLKSLRYQDQRPNISSSAYRSAWRHERQFAQSIDFLAGKKQDKCGNRAYTLVERVIYFSNNWDIDFGGWRMREIRHPRELILACQGEESPMGAEYFFGENVMIWLSISFPFVNHALFNLDDILLPLLALRETEKGMACMARPNQKFLRYY